MNVNNSKISVVIPVYKSEKTITALAERLASVLTMMERDFEMIFVDDFSPDSSWATLRKLKEKYGKELRIARLSGNTGQHNAILCGLSICTGSVIVTMDDDLQNPPEEVPKLVEAIDQGFDLAIGAYEIKKHSKIRNVFGNLVDRILRIIFKLPNSFQLTSFRAVKRHVVENVNKMSGVFPYLTAMLFANTSNYTNVKVRHEERQHGKSNYNFRLGIGLIINLILSYSNYPLYLIGGVCLIAFLFSFGYGLITIYNAAVYGTSVPGWASLIVLISLFNSLLLLSIFIISIYISRINQQITRARVSYRISELYE